MFTTFLIFDVLIALGYYFVSPWFFWYVKNGTRAEVVKCGWFLFAGFIFFILNLMVIIKSMITIRFTVSNTDVHYIIVTNDIVHPLITFIFAIWHGTWVKVLLPDLLERLKDEC